MKVSPTVVPPDDATTNADDVLTVAEAARLLRVGRNLIYDAVSSGKLPHLRIGRKIRLSRIALMRSLGSCGPQDALKGQ